MIIAPTLVLSMNLAVKPEIDKLDLMKSKFECASWENEPYIPYRKGDEALSEEELFRKLLDAVEKQSLESLDKTRKGF